MKNPLVSIFCSIYKGEEYIQHYLHDICRQTIFSECELILIDGASPEKEVNYIRKFQQKHDNIKYIRLEKDPGMYACWNIGVAQASGKYLNNANVDDGKHPTALQKQVEFLENNPTIDLVYTDSFITEAPNQLFETCFPTQRYNFPDFSVEDLIIYNMPHQSPVYKKSLHEKFGLFEEGYRSAADGEFWLRCATKGAKMAKLDSILGLYYFNPNGVSTSSANQEWRQREESEIKKKYSLLNNYKGPIYGNLSDIITPC